CDMHIFGHPGPSLAVVVALVAVLHAQNPAGQNGTAPGDATASAQSATELPAGDGRDVVVAACSGCHGLSTVTEARRTRTSWEDVVDEMIGLGAKFEGDEAKKEAIAYQAMVRTRECEHRAGERSAGHRRLHALGSGRGRSVQNA